MCKKYTVACLFLVASLLSGVASAGERTVTLAVDKMFCALCPITVRQAIAAVPGVSEVQVDPETKTAVVTFDDTTSGVAELTAASANAGYPAHLVE